MAPAQSHHYVALNHNAAEFRLVTFERTKDGAIRGRLHVFPMSKCPAYVAISFDCGKTSTKHSNPFSDCQPATDTGFTHSRENYNYMVFLAKQQNRNHQVGMMGQIFSNADFMIAWLGLESDRSVEAMQAISTYRPKLLPVPLSIGPLPLPQHLRDMLNIFGSLKYWSRLWIVQEIMLAKDILISWGNEFLPWYKVTNFTNEYEENWVKLVMEKERRNFFLRDPGRSAGDIGSMKPPSLYALIVQFAGHGCIVPRDKVIGLLGLVPDDAAHLADYSTPKDEYFREICKYAFITARINGEWAKTRFQCLLGEILGLSAYEYSVRISNP
ncbi:uncharacterized protein PAC_18202 [Phialocephala subalpina]|uniref:Heterokaryon incompatibility domain-containing protein n=1 Tax=Phialocephala subalpina TaxID=576137 RepID=A0A1L7XTE5_9HELO|nr:uncharacterized protein PAC_18202 [Phialocephala subalpina]